MIARAAAEVRHGARLLLAVHPQPPRTMRERPRAAGVFDAVPARGPVQDPRVAATRRTADHAQDRGDGTPREGGPGDARTRVRRGLLVRASEPKETTETKEPVMKKAEKETLESSNQYSALGEDM